jgi:hypothetical protein
VRGPVEPFRRVWPTGPLHPMGACPSSAQARAGAWSVLAILTLWASPSRAQQSDQNLLFDPTRLSVQQTFGYLTKAVPNTQLASPPSRAFTSETEIAYMVTDLYRLSVAVPVSLSAVMNRPPGGTNDKFSWNGVSVRNLFIHPIDGTGGSFVALGADFAYAPLGALFPERPGSRFSATFTPIVGIHHDPYDLTLSAAVTLGLGAGAVPAVSPSARLTRHVTEDVELGVEYDGGLGQFGAVPLRNQSHLIFGVTEFKLSGFDLSLGLGYGLTPASTGVAARFGIGHGF